MSARDSLREDADVERHEERMDDFYARLEGKTTWDGIDLAIVEELMAE